MAKRSMNQRGRMLRGSDALGPSIVSSSNASQGPKSSWGGGAVRIRPRRRGPACRRQDPEMRLTGLPSRIATQSIRPPRLTVRLKPDTTYETGRLT